MERGISEVDFCYLDRDSGPCSDAVTQWYFDAEKGQCLQFTYGGCRGNRNRFNSREQCEMECSSAERLATENESDGDCFKTACPVFMFLDTQVSQHYFISHYSQRFGNNTAVNDTQIG